MLPLKLIPILFHVTITFAFVPSRHVPTIPTIPTTTFHQHHQHDLNKRSSFFRLYGIRGFRSWFESQFPNAMTTIHHPPSSKPGKRNSHRRHPSSSPSAQSETFHHVLIDMNQLLHITLRRSRSEGHALTLLIHELDKCLDLASPTKSVVLAFDGPPAAAKLATQRRRRYGTVIRAERKRARMEVLKKRGVFPMHSRGISSGRGGNRSRKRKRDKAEQEEETLKITPGTEFMDRAHEAVLYWAWQRLEHQYGRLAKCRIYISPSTVPGEGEVKLLDWLVQAGNTASINRSGRSTAGMMSVNARENGGFQNVPSMQRDGVKHRRSKPRTRIVKPGESVAILGGDSDLVLEGLIIPPTITHNVFVILPSSSKTSYVVSLWETTLALGRFLAPDFDNEDIMFVRTDLVLLLIMNGNDYLPKLRGSAGFNKLFHTYLRLLKKWLKDDVKDRERWEREQEQERDGIMDNGSSGSNKQGNSRRRTRRRPYLVDPDTLEFNLPFCIAYFEKLASMAPKHLVQPSEMIPFKKSITPLSHLYSMVDAGFLPKPAEFERIPISKSKKKQSNPKYKRRDDDDDWEILRLTLGENSGGASASNKKIEYEVEHCTTARPLKKTKQILANMALEDLLGKDYKDMDDYIVDAGDGDGIDDNDDDLAMEGENGDSNDDDFNIGSINGDGYSWEITLPAAGSVDEYLKGLLWNLATYQDGICSNYGYNYGRRMSPTAEEVVSYLKEAQRMKKRVNREELLGDEFIQPLNAGLSCLAALPAQVNYLVPEPYQRLSTDNVVEDLYGRCMDPENNVFDMQMFQRLCSEAIGGDDTIVKRAVSTVDKNERKPYGGRQVKTGDTFWTVLRRAQSPLVHPFEPPRPFSDRLSYLKHNPRIKATHIIASDTPRWLRGHKSETLGRKTSLQRQVKTPFDVKHSDMGELLVNALGDNTRLEDVGYKVVYQQSGKQNANVDARTTRNKKSNGTPKEDQVAIQNETLRLKQFGIDFPQKTIYNTEKNNAIQCLQQLHDADLIQSLEWKYEYPSTSQYASEKPELYEQITVSMQTLDQEIFTLSQDRNAQVFSRKRLRHSLAAKCMSYLFQNHGEWSIMTIEEMKQRLSPPLETLNALQCLHELRDARCFNLLWDFGSSPASDTKEIVRLSITGNGSLDIVLEETRDIYQDSKSSAKHSLATLAMDRIMQDSTKDWKSMTITEVKKIVSCL